MPSSKRVISKSDAENVVLPFQVKQFPIAPSEPAQSFVRMNSEHKSSNFQIDPLIAEQSGIAHLQKNVIEQKIEAEAIAGLQAVQEEAYKQAYELGLQEGAQRAYSEKMDDLNAQIHHFDQLCYQIENLKVQLTEYNEAHLMKMLFYLASRLARREIKDDHEMLIQLVKDCVLRTQQEENIRVLVSPEDLQFLQMAKQKLSRENEVLKNVKIEAQPNITPGGCIVETNYGHVDATLETRVEKLWEALEHQLPHIRQRIGA